MKNKKLLIVQIAGFLLSAISIALTPATSYESTMAIKIFSIIIGTAFWLGLILGIVVGAIHTNQRKTNECRKEKIGLISFFKNKWAFVFDSVMIISFVISIIFIIMKSESAIASVIIGIFIFSFEMHCVLNGKYFNHMLKEEDNQNEKEIR